MAAGKAGSAKPAEHDLLLWEDEPMTPTGREHVSFSLTSDVDHAYDDDEASFSIPSPVPQKSRHFHHEQQLSATAHTPLNPRRKSRGSTATMERRITETTQNRFQPTNVLFGRANFTSQRNFKGNDAIIKNDDGRPKGLSAFFFGFMYEEPCPEDELLPGIEETSLPIWNRLNFALFLAYGLTTAAETVPVTLVPLMAQDFLGQDEASTFASRVAASAVMGTACGKFLNGPMVDVFGARRVSCIYSMLLSVSLLGLALCQSASAAIWACFFVEFCQSVQWPCIIVILAAHYRRDGQRHGMYEGGIYVTSLASRFGSLLAIPASLLLLRNTRWHLVAQCAVLLSLIGSAVMFLFVSDSPGKVHNPQNPIQPPLLKQSAMEHRLRASSPLRRLVWITSIVQSVLVTNVFPSLRTVIKSGTFWIVAIAHTGASMVRSSERILGAYFRDTSFGTLSENRAGGLAVFMSFGILAGLAVGGNIFTRSEPRKRKRLVSRLYMLTIAACYLLSILAVPRVRVFVGAPGLILLLQIVAVLAAGFGIAVQCYHIPGVVGVTFGHNKGLYAAYTDGVANGISSLVWRIVGGAVEEGNQQGGGWAYGWAAVALLVILCAVLMVEFMEHYFVRTHSRAGKPKVGYETLIFV